jgi:membrane-associated protease RseP (regulator of RpoE activity)
MDFLTGTFNFVLIILGFGLLIFVHEAGHFLAAKWAGIRTEVFAVGMGTPVVSWRKGIGWALGSTQSKVVARAGKAPVELTDEELERHGIGETEYSLRWLPIGGFVKMLGQDDLDPSAVSARPRSYNICPVPRRMVVISAGVIANIILALVLFVWAFMVGVGAEQPVVGQVDPSMPGAGLIEPGDRVLAINDREVRTFADIDIYVAMAKPEEPVSILVDRPALPEPLNVQVVPQKDPLTGLLGIGVSRGRSNTLYEEQPDGTIAAILEAAGFAETGLRRAAGCDLRPARRARRDLGRSAGADALARRRRRAHRRRHPGAATVPDHAISAGPDRGSEHREGAAGAGAPRRDRLRVRGSQRRRAGGG